MWCEKMVKINPYLLVKNGKESIKLYEELFGAKQIEHMPFTKEVGTQFGFSDDFDYENSTMHAELEIGGATFMLSDNPMNNVGSGNVQIFMELDSKDELDAIHEKVQKKKFTILMPLEKTFWGSWFLVFEDSNGIGWQLAFTEEQ
jgi:PhnB protein